MLGVLVLVLELVAVHDGSAGLRVMLRSAGRRRVMLYVAQGHEDLGGSTCRTAVATAADAELLLAGGETPGVSGLGDGRLRVLGEVLLDVRQLGCAGGGDDVG